MLSLKINVAFTRTPHCLFCEYNRFDQSSLIVRKCSFESPVLVYNYRYILENIHAFHHVLFWF